MAKEIRAFLLLSVISITVIAIACDDDTLTRGFYVDTYLQQPGILGISTKHINIGIDGFHISDVLMSDVGGNVYDFQTTSGPSGRFKCNNCRVAALWRVGELTGPCAAQSFETNITNKATVDMVCRLVLRRGFGVSPQSISTYSQPVEVTINGDGISAQYGMPMAEIYDWNGAFIGQSLATACNNDGTWEGTWLTTTINPTFQAVGLYTIIVKNKTADGGWESIGGGVLNITSTVPPTQCDPAAEEDCLSRPGWRWDAGDCSCEQIEENP